MALRVALDTNRLTDLFGGDRVLAEELGYCQEVWIPLPVLGEIRAGFLRGNRQASNEAALQVFPWVEFILMGCRIPRSSLLCSV